jgi:hypothetical protein
MSDYGKLWAEVAEIRHRLKSWLPDMPTNTLADAQAFALTMSEATDADKRLKSGVESSLQSWAELEKEMKSCDSHTGNR